MRPRRCLECRRRVKEYLRRGLCGCCYQFRYRRDTHVAWPRQRQRHTTAELIEESKVLRARGLDDEQIARHFDLSVKRIRNLRWEPRAKAS
jgi:hypothetical protein